MLQPRFFLPVLLLGAAPAPAPTATPLPDPCGSILSIVTRPTVTTSVCTVRTRRTVLETGYTNTVTTGAGGFNTANYPQSYLRFGSGDSHLEYDLLPPSVNAMNLNGAVVRGATDMGFGIKSELGYTAKASWGVNAAATLPSGSAAFTSGAPTYTGNFNWTYTVNSVVGLAGTLGFNSLAGTNASGSVQRFFTFVPSLEVTAAWPANAEFFAEYAFFSEAGPGLGGKSLIDYGVVYDVGPHLQLDVESGVQPTAINGQRQHYVGAGISLMNS